MHKNFKLFLFITIFITSIVFYSGCINSETKIDSALQKFKNAGKIVAGTCTPYEPMEYIDEQGDIVGFDIDLAKAIADSLGVELEIKNYPDFNMTIFENELDNGYVDIIIAAITITVERSEQVLFSNPYFNAGQIIIVNATNNEISTPEDLENKKVGVQIGTTSESEAEKYTNSSVLYNDYSVAVDELVYGFIDAIVIDYPAGSALVKENDNLKIVGDPFTNEWYGIAMKPGEDALKNKINDIINSDVITSIEEKWF